MVSMVSMHNGPLYIELAPYGIFLAGSEHANCLHRTMHISYFKLCHYMRSPMSVRSEIGALTWGVPCQCVEK